MLDALPFADQPGADDRHQIGADAALLAVTAVEFLADPARAAAERALELDANDPRCHLALGMIHAFNAAHDKAQHHLDRAAELNPNDDLILVERGRLKMYSGAPIDGAGVVRLAMRRNPFHPNLYWNILGRCYHTARKYEEALQAFGRIDRPLPFNRAYMAACHAALGQADAAQRQVSCVLDDNPDFTVSRFARQLPYRDEAVLQDFVDGLIAAGLPPYNHLVPSFLCLAWPA